MPDKEKPKHWLTEGDEIHVVIKVGRVRNGQVHVSLDLDDLFQADKPAKEVDGAKAAS